MSPSEPPLLKVGVFPAAAEACIARHFALVAPEDCARDPALRARVAGIVTRSNYRIDPDLIDSLPALRVIATCGVGYDGIPVAHARARGVEVTHTPGVLDGAVAELTLALTLAALRRLPMADAFVRDGRWAAGAAFPLTANLAGKRVGLVGMGRIGHAIARLFEAFDVRISYHARHDRGLAYRFEADLHALARDVDILVVCCPGGPDTEGLIGASVLAALGPSGLLVNVSRGSVVDEDALARALRDGGLAGAALDVYREEPTRHTALTRLDNVVLSPHIGSATHETRLAMAELAVDNLRAVLAGRPAPTPVPAQG